MFFSIKGSPVYRFKKPSFWFIWVIQKPLVCFLAALLCVVMVIATFVVFIISAVSFINDIQDPTGLRPDNLGFVGSIMLLLLYGLVSARIYRHIDMKRRAIREGHYRQFYATEDDFSFQILFMSQLRQLSKIPDSVIRDVFMDQDIIKSDDRLRKLGLEYPEDLRIRRDEQKRVLNLVQGFYLRAGVSTIEILETLRDIHVTVDAMTNHLANDLLDTYNGRRESLVELIRETRLQA